jgi:hypothetical protein
MAPGLARAGNHAGHDPRPGPCLAALRDEHDFTWRAILAGSERQFCPVAFFVVRVLSGIKHVVSAAQQHYFHIRHPDAIARAVERYT